MTPLTYTARWIFPIDTPPLERGTITLHADKILAVEPHGRSTPDIDLGNVAILPGFANSHTHLDLSGAQACRPPVAYPPVAYPPGSPDFTQWLRGVIAFRRGRTPEQVQADIAAGLAECLRYGTTMIGDIAAGGASWEQLGQSPCRGRMFYELIGLSEARAAQSWDDARRWSEQHPHSGLSPHAPYSVRSTLYSVLSTQYSSIATHLAETQDELELLGHHRGPFVDFLKELGAWDPSGLVPDPLDVIRMLPRGIFVHCNYLDAATPFTKQQTVVVCPRTHAAFGHPRHPFPEFLKRGIRVALGTDSLASNPDLDILAEARFLRQQYPEVEPATLMRMLTLSGAEALGFDAVAGSLTPGKSADLVVLPLPDDARKDPHDLVLTSAWRVVGVMCRGTWIVKTPSR
jgi:aminodeoxyfutalosine deaminase